MISAGYVRASSVESALASLLEESGTARVLAGGTDLLVSMRRREVAPSLVVDISGLRELGQTQFIGDGGVVVGATVTHTSVVKDERFADGREALVDACGEVGSWQVRNLGTLGGNVCNGSPAAETASPLLVLGAHVTLASEHASRSVDLEEFFVAPGRTALRPGELLTAMHLPALPPAGASAYVRVSPRRAMDIAVAGAAAFIQMDAGTGECVVCRIALTGVAPTPVRAREAEDVVIGSYLDQRVAKSAGMIAGDSAVCVPIDDQRATCEYRRAVVPTLVERALNLAWTRAQRRAT